MRLEKWAGSSHQGSCCLANGLRFQELLKDWSWETKTSPVEKFTWLQCGKCIVGEWLLGVETMKPISFSKDSLEWMKKWPLLSVSFSLDHKWLKH